MLKKLLFGVALVSVCTAHQVQADTLDCVSTSVQLSALIASDGCRVGDKLFSNFSDITNPAGSTPQPSDISVLGITINGNYGIQFSGGFFAGSGQTLDVLLSYVVTVLDPTMLLTDIHLGFNGAVTGTGFAAVTEQVKTGFEVLGQATVSTASTLATNIALSRGVTSAQVSKDIILVGGANGTAFISVIDQVTSQTATVPEPASLTLLGTGFLGLVRAVRRRRTATVNA